MNVEMEIKSIMYWYQRKIDICIKDRLALNDVTKSIRKFKKKLPIYQEYAMVDEICDKFGLCKDMSNYLKEKVEDNYDFFSSEDECSCDNECWGGYEDCGDYVDDSLMCSCCYHEDSKNYRPKDPERKDKRKEKINSIKSQSWS